jgi:hypothetical protein
MDTRAASLYCSTCTFPTDLGPFLPRFSFTEANKDMNAAIRWVKTNGAKFHVDVSTTTSDNKSALRPAAIS